MTVEFDAEHAHKFLTDVYGGRAGLLQTCSTGRWLGEFFATDPAGITAAVAHAQALDTAHPQGVYFRATTVTARPPRGHRGGAELTAQIPILWGDVDHGTEGHKGANLPPTREAAELIVAECGMPAPTILVHSGGGYYPLWRLDRAVDPATAAALSMRLQALLCTASQHHGWDYGTGVSDLARVLRLPGSMNRKTTRARPCRVIGGSGLLLDPATIPEPPQTITAAPPAGLRAVPPPRPHDPHRRLGPLDALAEHCSWTDILESAGWTLVAVEAAGHERWLRPGGASSEYSARAFDNNLVVHSDNAGLPTGAGQRLTKGRVFAHLHHGGDTAAATRALIVAANGNGGTPAARALPAAALDAIRAVHDVHDADMWGRLGLGHSTNGSLALSAADRPLLAAVPTPAPPPGLARRLLPAEVWSFSPQLAHIYRAAMARLVCPDALLHAIFAIVASTLHHASRVETGAGPSVLSYYLSVVGASGAGKSKALSAARDLLAGWTGARHMFVIGPNGYIDQPLGSGEGVIEAFMGRTDVDVLDGAGQPVLGPDGKPMQASVRAQVRHNALFHTDEARQVLAIDARKGSTLFAVLCEMWSGSVAGQTNADAARTRKLESGSYVVGMLLGFQLATIDALFADEAGGAPQRFAFAPAEYAPFGDDLDAPAAPWPGELQLAIRPGPVTVALLHEHQQAVRRAIRAKAAGVTTDGPLDGHRTLLHCRIAALLALLHGTEHVSEGLWVLAQTITARSCELRDDLAQLGARKAAEQAQAKQAATVATTVAAQGLVQAAERVTRAAAQIARAVERAGGSLTRGKALHGIRSDLRDVRDAALDHAARVGLVVVSEDGKTVALPEGGE